MSQSDIFAEIMPVPQSVDIPIGIPIGQQPMPAVYRQELEALQREVESQRITAKFYADQVSEQTKQIRTLQLALQGKDIALSSAQTVIEALEGKVKQAKKESVIGSMDDQTVRNSLQQARDTNTALHRRVQQAESKAEKRVNKARRERDQMYKRERSAWNFVDKHAQEVADLKAQLDDQNRCLHELLCSAWSILYPDNPEGYEYRTQPIVHLRVEIEKLRDENAKLKDADKTAFATRTIHRLYTALHTLVHRFTINGLDVTEESRRIILQFGEATNKAVLDAKACLDEIEQVSFLIEDIKR